MANDVKKETVIPKLPTLNFGAGRPSIFSKGVKFMPKNTSKGRFNQATFHTQHKGGAPGGGK